MTILISKYESFPELFRLIYATFTLMSGNKYRNFDDWRLRQEISEAMWRLVDYYQQFWELKIWNFIVFGSPRCALAYMLITWQISAKFMKIVNKMYDSDLNQVTPARKLSRLRTNFLKTPVESNNNESFLDFYWDCIIAFHCKIGPIVKKLRPHQFWPFSTQFDVF